MKKRDLGKWGLKIRKWNMVITVLLVFVFYVLHFSWDEVVGENPSALTVALLVGYFVVPMFISAIYSLFSLFLSLFFLWRGGWCVQVVVTLILSFSLVSHVVFSLLTI